jgi:pimeloyl-ACP methyl ester carboxylesterase
MAARDLSGGPSVPAITAHAELKMTESPCDFIEIDDAPHRRRIAVRRLDGASPGLVWLGGFKSDMQGTKARALARWAAEQGRACVRFDYSGHGESEGAFTEGTIGRWLAESVAVFEAFCRGPQIVIGSSMGGWIALLLGRELRRRAQGGQPPSAAIAGLVLIAPAVDFTEVLMWQRFPRKIKR